MAFMQLLTRLFGFRVIAQFGGRLIEHRCWNRKEALEWAECYPLDARVTVFDGGALLFQRGAL